MSAAPSYSVGTIFEMAKIPADRFDAFLAELPEIVALIRAKAALVDEMNKAAGTDFAVEFCAPTWIDDGARNVTVRLYADDEQGVRTELCSTTIERDA